MVQLLKIIKGQYGVDELYAKFGIRAVMGVSNESGYQYEEELDYSLGGFGARDAGKFIERIANDIGFSVEIRYRWIEGGSRPGEESYLRINAKPHAPRLSAVD